VIILRVALVPALKSITASLWRALTAHCSRTWPLTTSLCETLAARDQRRVPTAPRRWNKEMAAFEPPEFEPKYPDPPCSATNFQRTASSSGMQKIRIHQRRSRLRGTRRAHCVHRHRCTRRRFLPHKRRRRDPRGVVFRSPTSPISAPWPAVARKMRSSTGSRRRRSDNRVNIRPAPFCIANLTHQKDVPLLSIL